MAKERFGVKNRENEWYYIEKTGNSYTLMSQTTEETISAMGGLTGKKEPFNPLKCKGKVFTSSRNTTFGQITEVIVFS